MIRGMIVLRNRVWAADSHYTAVKKRPDVRVGTSIGQEYWCYGFRFVQILAIETSNWLHDAGKPRID